MCGIAGVYNFGGEKVSEEMLIKMANTLLHRGPDGSGYRTIGAAGLAHTRLSILDTSDAGKQPMCNEDGTVWLTYNGEIYNFASLRRDLESHGHIFKSNTDSEVIIHAYEQWDVECVHRFVGMFSFAIWDARKERLWLVRDRLGIKPLFFARLSRAIVFGSEIKAVLVNRAVSREIDYTALSCYLSSNYVPAPYTLFKNVRQILPGNYMVIKSDGTTNTTEYWEIPWQEDIIKSEEQWINDFSDMFDDVVRDHLVSDVPFGAFLSGGLDSSSIVSSMSRYLDGPIKTFSIGFESKSFDETGYSKQVSKHIGTDHHVRYITPAVEELLPKLAWHAEEPTADSSMVATYYLAEESRKKVAMVLSGDGGDETLGGYDTYTAFYALSAFRKLPQFIRNGISNVINRALPITDKKIGWEQKLRRFLYGARYSPEDAHSMWRVIFNRESRAELLKPLHGLIQTDDAMLNLYRQHFSKCTASKTLNRLLYVDLKVYLPNDMLIKVDRMTMANGLEARVPFLDHRFVEFAASIPPSLKIKPPCQKKYILKESMKGRLPKSILMRKKAGFNMPKSGWIRDDLSEFVTSHLSADSIRYIGLFDTAVVDNLLKAHFRREADNSFQIWSLLIFVLWWRQFQQQENII